MTFFYGNLSLARRRTNITLVVRRKMASTNAVTVACHVIPASGRLVDVDIPELSESPWPGLDIF